MQALTGFMTLTAIHFVSFWYVLFWSSLGYYEIELYGLRGGYDWRLKIVGCWLKKRRIQRSPDRRRRGQGLKRIKTDKRKDKRFLPLRKAGTSGKNCIIGKRRKDWGFGNYLSLRFQIGTLKNRTRLLSVFNQCKSVAKFFSFLPCFNGSQSFSLASPVVLVTVWSHQRQFWIVCCTFLPSPRFSSVDLYALQASLWV